MGRFLFLLAVGTWLGTLVSFSYIFLPVIHRHLEVEAARPVLRRLFSVYYLVGIACGLIALAIVSLAPEGPTLPRDERLRLMLPICAALVCFVVTRQWILPRMAAIRIDEEPERYARTHRIAAQLNTVALAMLVLVVAAVATR